ncbi:MAG: hypothetical protein ACJASM_002872 [Salibacteraceae bacterium]|jgi:hypothetical protein
MKIFISWSGERSRQVAELLDDWIQCVLQAVDPWLSGKDIDRGSLWFTEITAQLSNTHNGIVCLTKANLNNPWILFESGALAKGLSSSRIYTLLIDLNPEEVRGPLAQFNHTKPEKESIYQLIRSINRGLEDKSIKEDILLKVFNTYWPQFKSKFEEILNSTSDEEVVEKVQKDDLLKEILFSVRGIDRRLQIVESRNEDSRLKGNPFSNSFQNSMKRSNEIPRQILLRDMGLSVKTLNVLKREGFEIVGDILELPPSKLRNLGINIRNEINQALITMSTD